MAMLGVPTEVQSHDIVQSSSTLIKGALRAHACSAWPPCVMSSSHCMNCRQRTNSPYGGILQYVQLRTRHAGPGAGHVLHHLKPSPHTLGPSQCAVRDTCDTRDTETHAHARTEHGRTAFFVGTSCRIAMRHLFTVASRCRSGTALLGAKRCTGRPTTRQGARCCRRGSRCSSKPLRSQAHQMRVAPTVLPRRRHRRILLKWRGQCTLAPSASKTSRTMRCVRARFFVIVVIAAPGVRGPHLRAYAAASGTAIVPYRALHILLAVVLHALVLHTHTHTHTQTTSPHTTPNAQRRWVITCTRSVSSVAR
jgi:hypothetical protein